MQKKLKILSWNVLIFNKKIDEAVEFLEESDANVICLQEVSDELLERLRLSSYHLATGTDTIFITNARQPHIGETRMSIVILSRYPIERSSTYSYPTLPLQNKIRSRLFHAVLYLAGLWKGGKNRNREALSVDIEVSGKKVRVFSIHLSLYTPQIRAAEFKVVQQNLLQKGMNIVAGDFNILESPYIKVWNWLQGGYFKDSLPWANERKAIEESFSESNLVNPFYGKVTHPIAQSQLDHILIPKNIQVIDREVIRKMHGSDHNPIQVNIQI